MKRKIKKIGAVHNIEERLRGIAVFRITGPAKDTGNRVTVTKTCTRQEAEEVILYENSQD